MENVFTKNVLSEKRYIVCLVSRDLSSFMEKAFKLLPFFLVQQTRRRTEEVKTVRNDSSEWLTWQQ